MKLKWLLVGLAGLFLTGSVSLSFVKGTRMNTDSFELVNSEGHTYFKVAFNKDIGTILMLPAQNGTAGIEISVAKDGGPRAITFSDNTGQRRLVVMYSDKIGGMISSLEDLDNFNWTLSDVGHEGIN